MFEVTQSSSFVSVQEVSSPSKPLLDDLVNVVHKLEGTIETLSKGFQKSWKSGEQKSRNRSPTPAKASYVRQNKICFYHKRFAANAQNVLNPVAG